MAGGDIYTQMNIVVKNVYQHDDAKQLEVLQECHSQLQKMESEAKQSGRKAAYEATGKAMNDAVNMIDAVRQENAGQAVRSALSLISNVALLAGPEGALVAAVLSVLSTIIAVFQPKQESLVSQITKVIKAELESFKFDMLKDKGAGLTEVGQLMIDEVQYLHKEF